MSVDDIIFSPVRTWRTVCNEVTNWIQNNRSNDRLLYPLFRPRPNRALYLMEFAEVFHVEGQHVFWRLEELIISPFEFNGVIIPMNANIGYPTYGTSVVGHFVYRSIEDVNLVENTYTSYYIFKTEEDAEKGLAFFN